MKFTQINDPFYQKLPPLSTEQRIRLLERRKSSMLHELKIVSERMKKFIESGAVSDTISADEDQNDKYRGCPKIPDSETRRLMTKDPIVTQNVLRTFARFSTTKEIFNFVLAEIEALQKKDQKPGLATKAK